MRPTPANLRAEISRHMISDRYLAQRLKISASNLSCHLNEVVSTPKELANEIGQVLNEVIGEPVFDRVDDETRPSPVR